MIGAERRQAYIGAALVLGAASLWGTLGLFGKALYEAGLSPLDVASVRAAFGAIGLGLWFAPRPGQLRVAWRDIPFFLVFGLLSIALFYGLYFLAIERTSIAVAAALLYTAPAFVLGISKLFGLERLSPRSWLALGLVLAGVFLVTGAANSVITGATPISLSAVVFGLGAAVTYALFTFFGKHALSRYDATRTVFWSFAFGAVFLGLVAPPWAAVARGADVMPTLILLGLGPTLGAYLLYLSGLGRLPATSASMLATAEPVVAVILGTAVLGEDMTLDRALGVLLVVAGAALISSSKAVATAARRPIG